jgi:hypothetical protein
MRTLAIRETEKLHFVNRDKTGDCSGRNTNLTASCFFKLLTWDGRLVAFLVEADEVRMTQLYAAITVRDI